MYAYRSASVVLHDGPTGGRLVILPETILERRRTALSGRRPRMLVPAAAGGAGFGVRPLMAPASPLLSTKSGQVSAGIHTCRRPRAPHPDRDGVPSRRLWHRRPHVLRAPLGLPSRSWNESARPLGYSRHTARNDTRAAQRPRGGRRPGDALIPAPAGRAGFGVRPLDGHRLPLLSTKSGPL